jgi:hypothetical protein
MTKKTNKQNQKRLAIMTKRAGLAALDKGLIVTKFSMLEMSTMKDGLMDYCQVLIEGMKPTGEKYTTTETFSFMWDDTLNENTYIEFKETRKCPYCKDYSDSTDPKILCKDCRQLFGHSTIEEL